MSAPAGFKGTPGASKFDLWWDSDAATEALKTGEARAFAQIAYAAGEKQSESELGAKLSDLHWKFRRGGWRPTLEEMNEIEALLKKAGLL